MHRIIKVDRANEYKNDGTGVTFSTNASKVVPYDTGKVRIGCRWVPPPYKPLRSEEAIQDLFLDSSIPRDPWWTPIIRKIIR